MGTLSNWWSHQWHRYAHNRAFKSDTMSHSGQIKVYSVLCLQSTVKECSSSSPTSYFWFRKALDITNSIEESGEFNPIMTGCLLAGWAIVSLAMIKGIKSSAKVRKNWAGGMTISRSIPSARSSFTHFCSDHSLSYTVKVWGAIGGNRNKWPCI